MRPSSYLPTWRFTLSEAALLALYMVLLETSSQRCVHETDVHGAGDCHNSMRKNYLDLAPTDHLFLNHMLEECMDVPEIWQNTHEIVNFTMYSDSY